MITLSKTKGYTQQNTVEIIQSGRDYFQQVEKIIKEASAYIHLQVYIFSDDATGKFVAKLLKEAALRGVTVFMIVDGYASQNISAALIAELKNAGVYFKHFDPLLRSKHFYLGRRMHHKILIADGQCALIGGINISDNYNDTISAKAWLDFAALVKGLAVLEIQAICEKRIPNAWRPNELKRSAPLNSQENRKCMYEVGVRVNDWVNRKMEITNSYLQALKESTDEVILMSPYFLPGNEFKRNLGKAAKRGVKIKVIVAGISDVTLSKHAERYMYHWMFRNGISIYEYQKSILHGKLSVVDCKWLTIGSYNLNSISAHASIELNLEIPDSMLAGQTRGRLLEIIRDDCVLITEREFNSHSTWYTRLKQKMAYHTFRFIFFIFTFYFRQE